MFYFWVRDLDAELVKSKIKHLGLMPLRERDIEVIKSRSRLLKGLVFFISSIISSCFWGFTPNNCFFIMCFMFCKNQNNR